MSSANRFLSAIALAVVSTCSFASTTTYTSSSSFLAQVGARYTESFTGLASTAPGVTSMAFSGSGFSYTASSDGGLYLGSDYLGAGQIATSITLSFSGNVYAVGGNFFTTDISDNWQAVSLTVQLNDGTSATLTPTSLADSYRGFVSTTPIVSLTINAPVGDGLYRGLDNLTVAAAVPEPASVVLMALGVAGLVAARRRPAR